MHSDHFSQNRARAFTLVELLTVMVIIAILAGLVLGTFKLVQEKGYRARADSEIKAMETALESYKVDNGDYPRDATDTDVLNARTDFNPTTTKYLKASLIVYRALSGDTNLDRKVDSTDSGTDIYGKGSSAPAGSPPPKSYYQFKPNNLSSAGGMTVPITAMIDPFGNSYGYSTAYQSDPVGTKGYNPTFDLWSTGGMTNDTAKWLKNW